MTTPILAAVPRAGLTHGEAKAAVLAARHGARHGRQPGPLDSIGWPPRN